MQAGVRNKHLKGVKLLIQIIKIILVYADRGFFSNTALRNHNRIVFEELSSWTDITWYVGLKTAF